jgi:glycosyl transferase family 2
VDIVADRRFQREGQRLPVPGASGDQRARNGSGRTLSVCIVARDAGSRLRELIEHVGGFADQIVVGVDDASTDDTLDVARAVADIVVRFAHPRMPDPALMDVLRFARGDWILSLDDDERVDGRFPALLPELLEDERHSHYWFPRKWVVDADPPRYVRAHPWYPDWQLRLFRNDLRTVWHPVEVHEGYRVVGMGSHEARTSIVHLERLLTTERDRQEKVRRYRRFRGDRRHEDYYGPIDRSQVFPLEDPPVDAPGLRDAGQREGRVVEGVRRGLEPGTPPPWGAMLGASTPARVEAGSHHTVEVLTENTGALRWIPPREDWPRLFLSYHVARPDGAIAEWDGARTPIGAIVDPGERWLSLARFVAPTKPGEYLVGWDVVSEGEIWFSQCGSAIAWDPLTVVGRGGRGR